jgi:hypothetical protein
MCFTSVRACGLFALRLSTGVVYENWESLGLPANTNIRVGVHAGPAIQIVDPLTGRKNFVGAHVSYAARIEPITPKGSVFASMQVRVVRFCRFLPCVPQCSAPARARSVSFRNSPNTYTPRNETRQFAALAELEGRACRDYFRCRYVGNVSLAKSFGVFPTFHLTSSNEDGGGAVLDFWRTAVFARRAKGRMSVMAAATKRD